MRAITRAASACALAGVVIALATSPAHAAAYRYWTYWQAPASSAGWAFASQGPGTSIPADGDVEGWAFGVTTQSGSLDDAPSATPDFATICADTPGAEGQKRVALVVDTGSAAIAPSGQVPPAPITTCVQAPADASGYDVLRAVAEVRVENGLVCGIGGYPVDECAPVLDDAEAQSLLAAAGDATAETESAPAESSGMDTSAGSAPEPSDSATPLATLAVGVLLIGGAAFWYRRGRRGH